MAISIKNPHAERLAREIAEETGESMTQGIITALEERMEKIRGRRKGPDLVEDILNISRRCAQLPDLDTRPEDEILGYGSTGAFE